VLESADQLPRRLAAGAQTGIERWKEVTHVARPDRTTGRQVPR
jgi:hypothetical protein